MGYKSIILGLTFENSLQTFQKIEVSHNRFPLFYHATWRIQDVQWTFKSKRRQDATQKVKENNLPPRSARLFLFPHHISHIKGLS